MKMAGSQDVLLERVPDGIGVSIAKNIVVLGEGEVKTAYPYLLQVSPLRGPVSRLPP